MQLNEKRVTIHARLIFSQGLVFLDINRPPNFLNPSAPYYKNFINFHKEQALIPLQAALGFVLGLYKQWMLRYVKWKLARN